ncbi:uncharacterized protein LOC144710231 [Wolffia australiana]
MKRKRKVNFSEDGTYYPGWDQRHSAVTSTEERGSCPKTLEYKYFLSLIQETGHGSLPHNLVQRENGSSSSKEGTTNLLSVEAEMNVKMGLSGETTKELAPFSIIRHHSVKEPQFLNGENFSAKRQNLGKLAASVFFLEESEIKSKSRDFIELLMRRLGTDRKFETIGEVQKKINFRQFTNPNGRFSPVEQYEISETMNRPIYEGYRNGNNGWEYAYDTSLFVEPKEEQFFPKNHIYSSFLMAYPDPISETALQFNFSETMEASNPYEEPVSDHAMLMESDHLRNCHASHLIWDETKNMEEIPSASESPGKDQYHNWPLTLYNKESHEQFLPESLCGYLVEDYACSDFYEDSLSYGQDKSSVGRMLIEWAGAEVGTHPEKECFYLQERDDGDFT